MTTAPDAEGGDALSDALERALGNFGAMVRRVGFRHRLSPTDVEELLQDVRIRLWRARPDSEQIREVTSSYVYRTAVSAALDLIRRRRGGRTESLDEMLDDGGAAGAAASTTAAAGDDPAARLAESELGEVVAQVVDTLVPARRPVVRMHLAGYSREEIAELLGWSEAKTRNLLYRGLADLRERLAERGIGPADAGPSRQRDGIVS